MIEIIRWAASGTGMFAAIVVASNINNKWTGAGFIVFTISSVFWIVASHLESDSPLLVQNVVLFCINLFGIYRYLWKRK